MIASNEKLIAVFEHMAPPLGVRYDRSELRKLFSAAELAGTDPLGALYRVAERYRIRLGVFDCSFDEALQFVNQGFPIAIAPPLITEEDAATPANTDDWWVLSEVGRRGVLTWSTRLGGQSTWKSMRALRAILGAKGKDELSRRLIVAQPLDAALMGDKKDKPLNRFIALLKPEKGDILAIVVFAIVVGVLGLATPLAVESLVNTVAFNRYVQPIVVLGIILFVFLTFAGALKVIMAVEAEIIQRRLFVRVGIDLGHRLSNVDYSALDGQDGRELVNRFLDITNVQKAVSSMLLDGVTLIIAVIIGMIVLAAYHPFLLGFDIVLLVLMGFMIGGLGRGAVKTAIKESKEKYYMLGWLENIVGNPTAFRLHGGELFASDRTDQLAAHYIDLRKKHFAILVRQVIFAASVYIIASVVLLTIGGWLVINNQLTLGQLVAAELIVAVIVGAFAKMGKHLETYYDLMASIDKLGNVLDLPEAALGGHALLQNDGPLRMEVRDLSVVVEGKTVIENFSAKLTPGGSAVLVGPPGSGKSILLEALSTLRPMAGGSIEVNGIDLRQLDHSQFVRSIGFARGIEIFSGTITENVDLHRANVSAADLQAALQFVGLEDEIRQFEDGIETHLTQGGRPLTASQAARLMIARAIVGNPSLVLIDSLLDGLPPDLASQIISRLHARPMPWSLVVATSRPDFVDLFVEKWTLGNER
jgi:putative ABC transport system ATP-binding protein